MKKIFLIVFTLLSLYSSGQGTFTANGDLAPTGSYPVTRFGNAQTGYWPLTHITERDAIPLWQRTYGMMVYVKEVDSTYILKSATLDNSNWYAFKQGGMGIDASIFLKYGDTISLSNRIDMKVNTADLAGILGNYVLFQTLADSLTGMRYILQTKLSASDTASLSNRIDLKLNQSDTASLSNRINQRINYADSNSLYITLQQLRDSLATIQSGSSGGISLNVDRVITRQGLTGATGQNLGSGGKTVSQFLEAFFFPALAATPPTVTFTTPTTTFPYSTWKNWTGYSTNINFSWGLTNQSKLDGTDDKDITSINLLSGGSTLATIPPDNSGTTQSGTFTSVPFTNTTGSKTTAFNKTYTLQVIDAQPNTVTKDILLTMNPAIPLTVNNLTLTPSAASNIYEYESADKTLSLGWTVTSNDEVVTSQTVNGSVVTSSPQNVILPLSSTSQTYSVNVTGDIYSSGTTQSITATWTNRLYRGVITSAVPPDDAGFAFTSAQTLALGFNQLGGTWKNTNGYAFTCDADGQYIVFAYPNDNMTPIVQYYDATFGTWMTYSTSDIRVIDQAFVNQKGYSSNYRFVFVNVQYKSATVTIRLQ
jgi:hypothetical protein